MAIIKAHVSYDFNEFETPEKVGLGNKVIPLLTLNGSTFPDLPVVIADLTTANNTLQSTYADFILYGDSHAGAYLDAVESWKDKFTQTAEYCDTIANGSITIINLSGFDVTKTETTKAQKLDAPTASVEISVTKGEMSARARGVKTPKGYLFALGTSGVDIKLNGDQITVQIGDEVFSFIISSKRDVIFERWPSKIDVSVAVAAFNSAGLGNFSAKQSVTIP